MKTFLSGLSLLVVLVTTARSGTSETFDKGVAETVTESWYAEREFNLQLWGTYAFTSNDYRQDTIDRDLYLKSDHAWGGGLDVKYFFNRYLAVGLEGYVVSSTASFPYVSVFGPFTTYPTFHDTRTIGAGLGTITLRYPIGASRFAPYVFAGGGFIDGGGQQLSFEFLGFTGTPPGTSPFRPYTIDGETTAIGQFGGGLEIRLTRHVGLINDFTWNVVDGRNNNFGMARSGLNFAF
jgi:hypothetical protein